MSNIVADKCDRCGKIVVKHDHADSSDMVKTCDSFLYMCDVKRGESSRPSLELKNYYGEGAGKMWCPDCLLETISEWIRGIKERGPSEIPPEHVISGKKGVPSPCPICGK